MFEANSDWSLTVVNNNGEGHSKQKTQYWQRQGDMKEHSICNQITSQEENMRLNEWSGAKS